MDMLAALVFLLLADPVADLQAILDRNAKLPYEQRARARAIRDLGKIGSAKSTAVLIGLLDDPFAHQQDNAVSALIGDSSAVPAPSAGGFDSMRGWRCAV